MPSGLHARRVLRFSASRPSHRPRGFLSNEKPDARPSRTGCRAFRGRGRSRTSVLTLRTTWSRLAHGRPSRRAANYRVHPSALHMPPRLSAETSPGFCFFSLDEARCPSSSPSLNPLCTFLLCLFLQSALFRGL
ncbi:uncharacterized protein SCHCODRAFT_02372352 [Schizophyllum commune H4-8]|uniref:uncharacterized protein n=1 Tax=Schizophyllum commune (strain H4-8 / FGSC 9210) TaxID=578458 RepID=UPI00215F80E2|nr:uncharacterized protein SCHCODRAFT_02372352 [Schizophyllum commune H4-8]KAI5889625.1 hypothetical protein SCHCODRAFT_02372352 [Schizophyllum commune H4-8]